MRISHVQDYKIVIRRQSQRLVHAHRMSIDKGVLASIMISILMADTQTAFRHGMKLLFAETADIRLTDGVGSIEEMHKLLEKNHYDAILMEPLLLRSELAAADLAALQACGRSSPIIMFSCIESIDMIRKTLAAGASGYLSKSCAPSLLLEGIRKVVAGEIAIDPTLAHRIALDSLKPVSQPAHAKLSERELEVFELLAEGKGIGEIAQMLFRSPKTISTHKARLMRKIGVSTHIDLIRYALEHGLA